MAPQDTSTRDGWLAAFAERLGIESPDPATIDLLLEVAAEAAHSSERTAAPIACWLAGRAGASPEHALATARSIGA